MSGITNSDNGMMKNQQDADLGHVSDENAPPALKSAEIESPLPRLSDGVNADGMLEEGHQSPAPETEEARLEAVRRAAAAPTSQD